MDILAPLVLLAPLGGFLVNALLGRLLPRRVVGWVGAGSIGLALVFALVILSQVLGGQKLDQSYFIWWQSGDFNVPFNLYVDALSTLMILVITGVGFLIHVYSIGYMREDAGFSRFFAYMNLFVFSMLLLVLSGNFVWLIIGWALVGLSSYLLIGFWFERHSAVLAARKAFVMNTIGDVGMVFAAFLIFLHLRVLDFQGLFGRVHQLPKGGTIITAICLLLLVGAVAKSAQLPLHTWLPDAMEGPTPVSALIHAATMVTAGVYLVARAHALFERSGVALDVVAWVGVLTAVFAATIGVVQTDIKRVLAYSTVSQLGYMFVGVGVGAYAAGIFHLMTHACFKALLFLCAGSVIHGLHGEQDLRKMGGIAQRMLITTLTFLVGAVGLAGLPPFAGFFSKDEILAATFHHEGHRLLWAILLAGVFLTALYTARLVLLAFFGSPRMSKEQAHHIHESPAVMTLPLGVLAILTAVAGFVGVPSSHGTAFERFLAPVLPFKEAEHGGVASLALAAVSVIAALAGVFVAWLVYGRGQVDASKIGVPTNPF